MNAVIEREQQAIAVTTDAAAIIQVITRAASDPAVDINKLERLMSMHREIVAHEAQKAFNVAMSACQADLRQVAPDADNPQTRSKYATYAKLDSVLRPVYTKHGFALSFGEDACDKPETVRVTCIVSHIGGHARTYHRDMPADGKGAKGGDVMTKTHAAGAAGSYGARYLLKGIFNVAIGEYDNDGNDSSANLSEEEICEWEKKIEAKTTKEAAKAVWRESLAVCNTRGDSGAAERLKGVLLKHGEFIDKANRKA